MRISLFQTNPLFLDRDKNLADISRKIQKTSSDLFILPELCTSGYNFRSRRDLKSVAESIPDGPTSRMLIKCARAKNCAIVAGLPESFRDRYYNSSIFVTPRQIFRYRKRHLFGREKIFFSRGTHIARVHQWGSCKIGVMICFDWFFPEVARSLALKGADLIAHPSNLVLPFAPEGMKTRALENHVFTATANRVGTERRLTFTGCSQIIGPKGNVLLRLSSKKKDVGSHFINPSLARNKMITSRNHILRDRLPRFCR